MTGLYEQTAGQGHNRPPVEDRRADLVIDRAVERFDGTFGGLGSRKRGVAKGERDVALQSVGGDENPRIDGVRRNGGEISTAAMLSEPPSVPMIVKRSPESFALRA